MLIVRQEDLVLNTAHILDQLQEFTSLDRSFPVPEVKYNTLNKWIDHLSASEVADIKAETGVKPDDVDTW